MEHHHGSPFFSSWYNEPIKYILMKVGGMFKGVHTKANFKGVKQKANVKGVLLKAKTEKAYYTKG